MSQNQNGILKKCCAILQYVMKRLNMFRFAEFQTLKKYNNLETVLRGTSLLQSILSLRSMLQWKLIGWLSFHCLNTGGEQ